ALRHDLEMEHAEEAAAEPAAEDARGLLLERERGVREPQALEGLAELREVVLALRVYRCPDNGARAREARERGQGAAELPHRVAHRDLPRLLEARHDIAYLPR